MAKKEVVKIPSKVTGQLTTKGINLAKQVLEVDNTVNVTKRDLFLTLAADYLEEAKLKIVLDAYATTLLENGQNESSVKVRKSELKNICETCLLTTVTGEHLNALKSHMGTIQSLLVKCYELKKTHAAKQGEVPTDAPKEGSKGKKDLTDNETKVMVDLAKKSDNLSDKMVDVASSFALKANARQADTIIVNATSRLNGEQQLTLVSSILYNIIENENNEPFIVEHARELFSKNELTLKRIRDSKAQAEQISTPVYEDAPL